MRIKERARKGQDEGKGQGEKKRKRERERRAVVDDPQGHSALCHLND